MPSYSNNSHSLNKGFSYGRDGHLAGRAKCTYYGNQTHEDLWDCDEALDAIADKMLSNISKCNYCGQDYHEECDEALYETVDRMLEEERKKREKEQEKQKEKANAPICMASKRIHKGFQFPYSAETRCYSKPYQANEKA